MPGRLQWRWPGTLANQGDLLPRGLSPTILSVICAAVSFYIYGRALQSKELLYSFLWASL